MKCAARAPHGLIDVHAPALFIDGEVHWQMAAGPNAVDVRITASALQALSDDSLPSYLDVFGRNREGLCGLAALKFTARGNKPGSIVIERDDLVGCL